jgi:integrase
MARPRKTEDRKLPGIRKKTYTRGDGAISEYWQAAVYIRQPDGQLKREWVNQPSKKAAEEARAKRTVEVKGGAAVGRSKRTLGVYLDDWLEKHRVRKPLRLSTYTRYECIIRVNVKPTLGGVPLQQLTRKHIEDLCYRLQTGARADRRSGSLAPRSIRNVLRVLSEALDHAVHLKDLAHNPCDGIRAPKVDQAIMPFWQPDEAKRFLALLEGERYGTLFLLDLATGLRRGELLGLRWQDLDLATGTLRVRQNLVDVKGRLHIDQAKTPRSQREIPLPGPVVEALSEHRTRQNKWRLASGEAWPEGDLVFTTADGGPLHPRNVYRRFMQLVERSSDLPRISLHGMRHSAASVLWAETRDLLLVSQILGHAQPSTTANIYAHLFKDAPRRAAAAMEAALFEK